MNETLTTIVGNVVDNPNRRRLESGVSVTTFRIASTARRFDKVINSWTDANSLYLKVSCWRALAENVERSFVKGDPVVVVGRLYTRHYDVDGSRRAAYELEATAAGFDLSRGVSTFKRVNARGGTTVDAVGEDGIPTGGGIDEYLEAARLVDDAGEFADTEPVLDGAFAADEPSYLDNPFGSGSWSGDVPEETGNAPEFRGAETNAAEAGDESTGSASDALTTVGEVPAARPSSSRRRQGAALT